jgi:iron complex outermembrane receptor protein
MSANEAGRRQAATGEMVSDAIRSRVRNSAIAVALSLLTGWVTAAESTAVWSRAPTNLPPQNLGLALRSFALQRKFQIVFASKEVTLLRTQGAVGDLSVDEALEKILSGTGLTFVHLAGGSVAISKPDVAPDRI